VTSNEPVTINLSEKVSLKSALNLILKPLHLTHVILDEVCKITSEHERCRRRRSQASRPPFQPQRGTGAASLALPGDL